MADDRPLDLTPAEARWLYWSALRDSTRARRERGIAAPPFVPPLLDRLATLAAIEAPRTAGGRVPATVASGAWVTVAAAAACTGLSARHLRRLAQSGAIRARRVGSTLWQIEADALDRWENHDRPDRLAG